MPRGRAAAFMIFVVVIFIHFRIAAIGGYEVTLGQVAALAFVLLTVRSFDHRIMALALCAATFLVGVTALFAPQTSGTDFFRTFGLLVASVTVIGLIFGGRWRSEILLSTTMSRAVLVALLVVAVLSVLQVVSGSVGYAGFFNPFGANQYFHEYNPNLGFTAVPRAHGFYLEPSYNAFMICTMGTFLLVKGYHRVISVTAVVVGLVCTQSVIGFIAIAALTLVALVKARPAVAIMLVAIGGGVAAVTASYVSGRLSTIGTDGTSANYRLLAPIPALLDTLSQAPLGRPLGSIESVLALYDLNMAGVPATSLDNGYYVFIFYFGWIGVALLASLLIWALASFRGRSSYPGATWMPPVWIFMSLAFSGAVLAPEFVFLVGLTYVLSRAVRKDMSLDSQIVDNHRNIQRRSRLNSDTGLSSRVGLIR